MSTNSLIIRIQADTDKAAKEIKRLNKQIDSLKKSSDGKWEKGVNKGFKDIQTSAKSLNGTLKTLAATFLTFQTGKALIQTAADIEEGFLGIQKTTGLTGEAMKGLEDSILSLSTEMAGISIEELQTIAESAGQLGIQGTDNILEFTETIAMMGVTTDLSAEQAATGMAKFANSMGLPIDQVDNLGSAINELSNTTTATAGDLLNVGQRIAAMGKTFGLTSDEILAFSAAMKDLGVNSESGGSAFSRLLGLMLKDTEAFAEASGKSLEEFSTMINDKPVEAIKIFLEELGKLDKFQKIKVLDDLGVKSVETQNAVIKLSGGIDLVTKSLKTSSEAFEKNTSLQEEYAVFSQSFNAQMDKVVNTVKKLAVEIGNKLLPKLKELAEGFAEWVEGLDDAKIEEFSEDIADLVEMLGKAASAVGGFVSSIGGFITDYPTLSKNLLGFIAILKSIQFLLPGVGSALVSMGTSAGSLKGSTKVLTGGIGALRKSLLGTIALSNPWIAAVTAMGVGAKIAFDSYIEGAEAAAATNSEVAKAANASADGTNNLSEAYIKLNAQVKENGVVSRESMEVTRQLIVDEIAASQKRIAAMEQIKVKTDEQTQAIMQEAAKVGELQGQLDTLDARYTVDVEIEARKAEKELEDMLKKSEAKKIEKELEVETSGAKKDISQFESEIEADNLEATLEVRTDKAIADVNKAKNEIKKPVETKVDFKPDTKKADSARDDISKPVYVPVIYVPKNSPTGGGGGVPSTRGLPTPDTRIYSSAASARNVKAATPVVNFTTPNTQQNLEITFAIDGQKLKAALRNNTIENLHDFILSEGGM